MLSVLTKFLSNRSQYVVVYGCRSKLVNVVSGVLQGSILGPQLFLLYTGVLFFIVENKLYGYANHSTLVAVVPSPGERGAVSESMNRDLNRVSVWCNLWGMNLNESKTKTMIVLVVVVVGQTVDSISSKTLAYDCLYTLELCTASMIATN